MSRGTEDFCTSHWWKPNDPVAEVYWRREDQTTPSLFTHEEHHALTGYAHSGPDPCFTPAVGLPTDEGNRGFKMDLGSSPTGALSADALCLDIINTIYTR